MEIDQADPAYQSALQEYRNEQFQRRKQEYLRLLRLEEQQRSSLSSLAPRYAPPAHPGALGRIPAHPEKT